MKLVSLFVVICLILLPSTAPAPIYGPFPGLDKLIDDADFIVIAEITKRPVMTDLGDGGIFEIQVIKALKGDVKEGKRTAYLRNLPVEVGSQTVSSLTNGFLQGQIYLLFLKKGGTGFRDENSKPLDTDFECENYAGDAIWINQQLAGGYELNELNSLNGKSVRESIVTLLQHTARRHHEFANAVDGMIESHANPNILTRKITQTVWVDNTEAAAKFYLSIFKDSRPDPNINQYVEMSPDTKTTFTGVRLWMDGQEFAVLKRDSKSNLAQASAVTLSCDLQEEIDYYWDKLSAGGEKARAGWLKDKFGVWWHVVPTDLPRLLGGKYGDSERVMKAMLKMDKIDSAALWRAAHPEFYQEPK